MELYLFSPIHLNGVNGRNSAFNNKPVKVINHEALPYAIFHCLLLLPPPSYKQSPACSFLPVHLPTKHTVASTHYSLVFVTSSSSDQNTLPHSVFLHKQYTAMFHAQTNDKVESYGSN